MTTSIAGLAPIGLGTVGIVPSGCMSQYMDSGSVFNAGYMYPGMGCFGLNPAQSDAYFNAMVHNSDNMTSLQFVNNGNQHALNSYGEIMQKNLPEVAEALRNGEYGKAARLYDEVYEAVSKNYGREITTHQDRLNMDQSIKATISRAYQQINGTTIGLDARQSDEGYFSNGFMQGITLGNHHKATSEEIEAYMTGNTVEGYGSKKAAKTLGKLTGTAISAGAAAGVGFLVAGPIGAAVGGGVALLATLFSGDNTSSKVTEA